MYDSKIYASPCDMTVPRGVESSERSSRFQAIKEHLFSDLNDEAVILSLVNGKYYGLNSVGVTIWKNVQEAASIAEIEAAVLDEYDVDLETCRREVYLFLEEMMNEELINTVDEASS